MSRVHARRIARIAASLVLIAGAVYLARAAFQSTMTSGCALGCSSHGDIHAIAIIGVTWGVAIAVGLATWLVARRMTVRLAPDALFAESLMIPAIGIALILPITIHMPFVLGLGDRDLFDFWVGASLWLTGFAHLVFAVACAYRGYRLARAEPAWSPRVIYALTVVTSCFPFIVLFAIPPALVALTALPFLPILHRMEKIANRERAELADAPEQLPHARVI